MDSFTFWTGIALFLAFVAGLGWGLFKMMAPVQLAGRDPSEVDEEYWGI